MWPLLALLSGLPGFWSDPSAEGLKALDDKRYDAAVASFTQAVAADPKDFSAHFNLAFACGMLRRDADAIAEYRKALDLKPDLYEAQLNLGIVLIRDKQPADAATVLEKAAFAKPKEFRPVYYLGEALLASGSAEASQKAFQTATELDPKSAFAELGLARSLARTNKLDDAAPHFHKVAELDPARRDALLELAANYETAGKPDDAIALYSQFPDDAAAQERLGQLLLQANRAAEAVDHFKAAVAKSPTAANRVGLIQAYLKTNHPDLALPLVDDALAASPGDYDLVMLKGRILRDARKFDLAAAQFLQATKLRPADWMAWSELAGLLVVMENYPPALGALDHVRALNAEKPGHVFLRAIVLDKIQELEHTGKTHREALHGALESYQRFLELSGGKDPNNEFKARQRIRIIQLELNKR
ncbi:MAG: tetratricopeptide repeat protein [Bryobacteraceae bacterium]|jgi:tetratricopeptide (TPR) repeat protein